MLKSVFFYLSSVPPIDGSSQLWLYAYQLRFKGESMELQQVQNELRDLYREISDLEKDIALDKQDRQEGLAEIDGDGYVDDLEYNIGRVSLLKRQRTELEKSELVLLRDLTDQRTTRLIMLDEQIATMAESMAVYTREVAAGDNSARKWISRLSREKGGAKRERAALVRKLKKAGLAVQ